MVRLLSFTFAAALASSAEALFFNRDACPEVNPPTELNLTEYTRKTWYIQRQQLNSYQPEEDLYCITATYELGVRRQWGRQAISVTNVADRGQVNNPIGGGPALCATQRNARREPGKLRVAPCFLPPVFAGDYWVAVLDEDYRWAIITGGQPNRKGACGEDVDLCTTKLPGRLPSLGNGQGLWFLTRVSVADDELLEEIELAAANAGICTANMLNVTQQGCTYEGRDIK